MSNDPYYNKLQPNSYVILLRISAGLSTSAFLIGAYLILTKTPRRFGDYKWFIFNILVAAYAFDIYTSLIYAPIPLFPILYVCTLGPIKVLGSQFGGVYPYDLFIVLFGVANVSIIVAISFRFAILKGYSRYFCSKVGVLVIGIIQLTASFPIVLARHIAIGNPTENQNKVIQLHPQAQFVLKNEFCTGVSLEYNPTKTWVFMSMTFLGFFCAVPITIYLILKSFSMLNDFTSKMSPNTRRLHRQLLYSLISQFSVPFITLILPFIILVILASMQIDKSSNVAKYMVIFGTFHSVGNTLMMIVTIKPYRNVFLSAIGKKVEPASWLYTSKLSAAHLNHRTESAFSMKKY